MSNLARDLKKLLKQANCQFIRQGAGSHEIWRSPINNRTFTVPSNVKSRHTANGCLRDAGLPKQF